MKAYYVLFGFLGAGTIALSSCSPSVPDVQLSSSRPANIYSYEYLCELGYPDYEGYCDDFGSLGPGACMTAVASGDWSAYNNSACAPVAAAVSQLDVTFRTDVGTWIYSHLKWQTDEHVRDDCSRIADQAAMAVSFDQVRTTVANMVKDAFTIFSGGTFLIVVSPSRMSAGVAAFASDVIHEVSHGVFQLTTPTDPSLPDYGNDGTVMADGQTVQMLLLSKDQQCFDGFTQ